MTYFQIGDPEDDRLEPYRHLRQRSWVEGSGIFIAEGPQLVASLLESQFKVQSILLDEKFLPRFADTFPPTVDVLVLPHELVREVAGFEFHRGVLACGKRQPQACLAELEPQSGDTCVGLVGVEDQQNMGTILRTCAAFGVEKVVVGPHCCDPLSRRSLRVSMGNALKLDIHRCGTVGELSQWLASNKVISVATSLRESATTLQKALCEAGQDHPVIVWFGNEYHGLPEEVIDACTFEVGLQMHSGTDSLNVSVAAGIFIHGITMRK